MKIRGRRSVLLLVLCVCSPGAIFGQRGTAPNGYYPEAYTGSTFTGKVTQTTDETITLSYTHGNKTETLEARADSPCNLPASKTSTAPTPFTQVKIGSIATVFYEARTIKINGQKQKENQVIGISFLEVNGRPIAQEHRAIFYCLPGSFHTTFRGFQ